MTEYKIITADSLAELEVKWNQFIKENKDTNQI